jgi:exo-beta-1,3-glucanase (GH17 family)
MRVVLACFTLSALLIVGFWAWLGQPVPMPHSPLKPGEKLYCLSYSPFRGRQTPLNTQLRISAAQIEDDLSRLARITDCVRTYSVEFGQDQIAGIAARHGLTVMQGIWLSSHADKNKLQVETAVELANRYPDTIRSVIVGNEVLLRGEMSEADLTATVRAVKARVRVPVTYADVWEFWLRYPDVAAAVDFITIHILPYWEDFPIAARNAAAHVQSIRRRVVEAFAGKEVIIGEVGWPSAGRMREGALPSPSNQAKVIQDVLALAQRENFHVNVIEAFDEPWKRALEGTVGGHWGLLDDASRRPKFVWGEAVSDHPLWRWQAAGGVIFAMVIFGAAFAARRGAPAPLSLWLAVSINAVTGGLIGWSIANAATESLGLGGWLRSAVLVGVALLAPPLLSAALMREAPLPRFSRLLGPTNQRSKEWLVCWLGGLMIAMLLVSLSAALALVFDPRYRNFAFAPLTAAAVPFFVHSLLTPRPRGERGAADLAGVGMLALSIPYIALNEGFANWQSLWLCAALAAFAVSLARVRDAQS